MDKVAFFAHMDELLELPAGTLRGPEELSSVEEWDSLAVLSFIALLDETYGVTVAPKQIVACKTMDDLAALAGNRGNQLSN
jgi:acyl carrier protein